MRFKIGDVVVLKSGGGSMTVESIDEGLAKCVWHDGKVVRERTFPEAMLTEGDGTVEWALEQLDKRSKRPPPL